MANLDYVASLLPPLKGRVVKGLSDAGKITYISHF